MTSQLDQLKQVTTVVADSGEFDSIKAYKPQDATTNPSLILAAIKKPEYAHLMDVAVKYGKEQGGSVENQVEHATDRLLVEFGKAILAIVPGRVSTEVDASLSYDTQATLAKARSLIALYAANGINKDRVLIKIASTWQGIQAARELERVDQIHCNLTLLFGFGQAVACAEAGVTLISPFVGRILDWHKKNNPAGEYEGTADPGVQSVTKIYNYYKVHGYNTIVMGASFRSIAEITNLAGCDFLTIAPALLEKLANSTEPLPRVLSPELANAAADKPAKVSYVDDEPRFLMTLAGDAMANGKLAEGVTKFAEDCATLKELVKAKIQ